MSSSFSSVEGIPVRPIPPILPVGYRFDPTDEELIGHYLELFLRGSYNYDDMPIGFVDFWEIEPGKLPGWSKIGSDDQVWYFFCQRVVHMDKKKRTFKRQTPTGHWKVTSESKIMENLGKRSTLRFYKDSPEKGKSQRTEWKAYEYEIAQNSMLLNPGEFVIIKLMNAAGEKRTKMKRKLSKQNSKKKSTSPYDRNQSIDEVMVTSDCCSYEVPADFGNQNAVNMSAMSTYSIPQQSNQMASGHEVMAIASFGGHDVVPSDFECQNIGKITAMPTYGGGEPSSQATSSYQNQSSISEVREGGYFPKGVSSLILQNEEENKQSNRLLDSDFENQMLPSEVEDSPPKATPCAGNQVTQHKINPGCSVTSKLEDDHDFWSSLMDLDVDVAKTLPAVDPEVLAEWEAFRELQCSLNPDVQQTVCADRCI